MIVPSPYHYLGAFALAFVAGAATAVTVVVYHGFMRRRSQVTPSQSQA